MNIYIACALTHVPRELFLDYTSFQHKLAAALRAPPHRHDVKYALINSDPQLAEKPIDERARLCYLWDRAMVEEADLVIAEASFPSIGLGIEMQIAQEAGIPIVVCFRPYPGSKAAPVEYVNPDASHHTLQIGQGHVSLMALGLPEVTRVVKYEDHEDGISQLLNATAVLAKPP